MSTDLYDEDGISITRYCGPLRDDPLSRIRYQVTVDSAYVSVDGAQALRLAAALIEAVAETRKEYGE